LGAYILICLSRKKLERHQGRRQLKITLIPVKRVVELPADVGEPKNGDRFVVKRVKGGLIEITSLLAQFARRCCGCPNLLG
jgi:hypothetical protein